jgi:6-phosphogluconolactonase
MSLQDPDTAKATHATNAVYVANADSRDITVLSLHEATGALQWLQTVPVHGTVMPLAVAPDRRSLYAALRSEPYAVASFAIDLHSGLLRALGTAPLPHSMAYLATDHSGRWLFAASYGGDLLSVSPIDATGCAAAPTQVLPTGPHAHAAVPGPDNRFVYVTNLGADQVMQLGFDAATGRVVPLTPAALATRSGSGPRHLVWHPNGRWAYLLNELDASLDLLDLDADAGTLTARCSVSTLPPGFSSTPWAADLHLTPDGRFLYTSERTSSTLAMWHVDPADGSLGLLGHVPTERQPRGFQISPSGHWLLAVGQLSNSLTCYRIAADSGRLTPQTSLTVGRDPNWVEIVALPG